VSPAPLALPVVGLAFKGDTGIIGVMTKATGKKEPNSYSAADIEVLEGLEPVRRRPGMYVGGTDERALHHLVAEVLDNAMDEAVAGHATAIDVTMNADDSITITDNGRGIPVDPHPKYPTKSALEVIMTMLHSGGKFSNKAYETSGGLHGVGVSVVNALSDKLIVEVFLDKTIYKQTYSKGHPTSKLATVGSTTKRGTTITFHPDMSIFDKGAQFNPRKLFHLARSKAYLFSGVKIHWKCPATLIKDKDTPTEATLHYPHGLSQFLQNDLGEDAVPENAVFKGETAFADKQGRVEWALCWPEVDEGFIHSYCNTIVTPQGGTHEDGLRRALTQGLRDYGDRLNEKMAAKISAEDVIVGCAALLSVFIREPHFQGQTKEKLVSGPVTKWVENAVKDKFDIWLASNPTMARNILDMIIRRAEERLNKKDQKLQRKTATRRLRLPGKLADCSSTSAENTEIFIVEGDSAGGSAKQARDRHNQAILPLRGKILNVESASQEKLLQNKEIQDLAIALGCGLGKDFKLSDIRYERIIIMTDADVDGAHIASLLMTFFYTKMPGLIESGRLYLAQPPLFRLVQGKKSFYARTDEERIRITDKELDKTKKIDISRFKGLGEMPPAMLKETTMNPKLRQLLRVVVTDATADDTQNLIQSLMGKKAEARFKFIQENALAVKDLDV
jgi:topoisomerase-4 subunit B